LSVLWRRDLAQLGLTPEQFTAEVIGRHVTPTGITGQQATRIVTSAQVELFDTGSTWRRNDVIREIARRIPIDVNSHSDELVRWIERTADRVLERHVELAPRMAPNTPTRRDGRPITESTMDRRFTTTTILAQEEQLVTWALERFERPGRPAVLTVEGLDRVQQLAARAVAGTEPLVVIVGPAGAGKTSAFGPLFTGCPAPGDPCSASHRRPPLPPSSPTNLQSTPTRSTSFSTNTPASTARRTRVSRCRGAERCWSTKRA
jgi:hypothetical protein